MPANDTPPRVCKVCGEIHRNINSHLRKVHRLETDLHTFIMKIENIPKVWIESSWPIEHSSAESLDDLMLSILTNGKVVLTQKVHRVLYESNRTANIKRRFKYRTDLQYVRYDHPDNFSLFYEISTIKYHFADITLPRVTSLFGDIDSVELDMIAKNPHFSQTILFPLDFGNLGGEFENGNPNRRQSTFSVSALVILNNDPIFLVTKPADRSADSFDRSALIREMRRRLSPYPLIVLKEGAVHQRGRAIYFDDSDGLSEALVAMNNSNWQAIMPREGTEMAA